MPIRIRVRFERKGDELPPDLFCNTFFQRRNPGFGLLISCGLHCAAILALTIASAWWPQSREAWPPPGYEVQYLRVVTPQPFYFSPSRSRTKAPIAGRKAKPRNTTARLASMPRPSPPRSGSVGVMRIPRVQAASRNRMVLVQPQIQINVPSNLKLPEVFAWSRHQAGIPPAPVTPGHSEDGRGRPVAEPSLTAANIQERVGQVNVAPVPSPISAKLSIPPQTTTPISFSSDAGAESQRRISVDTLDADAVNLLSSSAQHPQPGELVRVPAGTAVPAGVAGSGSAAGSTSGSTAKETSGKSTVASASGASKIPAAKSATKPAAPQTSAAHPAVRQQAPPPAASAHTGSEAITAGSAIKPNTKSDSIKENVKGEPPAMEEAVNSGSVAPGAPLRKFYPKNGNFDVVLIQSPHAGGVPDDVALNGSQIYTVYLEVGTERPWVLQFCKPADAKRGQVSTGVLQVGDEAGIQPPYPVVTVVPPPGSAFPSGKLYVRGVLNREGRFAQLSMAGESAAGGEVLALLKQWQFRPAMESGMPIPVEVLLMIPSHETR